MIMEEIWKPILGYVGLYEVSNIGRIRSISHSVASSVSKSGERKTTGRILRQFTSTSGYYKGVHLCKNNQVKTVNVHKVVAEAFCDNPEHYNCIDHINGNSFDNRADNLRWCSHKQNSNNPITKQRMSASKKGVCGIAHNRAKMVAQFSLDGKLIKVWDYVKQAAEELNIQRTSISLCANGKIKSAGGYKWSYDFKV